MKLLIKFPTRERPKKFFTILDFYYFMLSDVNNTKFCISIDEDDKTMNNTEILSKLDKYENLYYYIGNNKNKIEAVNADLKNFDDYDILLLASDDMIPQVKNFDKIIIDNMKKYYPNTDGILWFFDGINKKTNTLSIMGKKYYDRFNYIYHPSYKSVFCDDEFTQVGYILKKQTFINKVIIRHEHPYNNTIKRMQDNLKLTYNKYLSNNNLHLSLFEKIKL